MRHLPLLCVAWIAITITQSALGQVDEASGTPSAAKVGPSSTEPAAHPTPVARRHALIVVGLPGDDEHRERFDQTTGIWQSWLTKIAGFDPQDITTMSATEDASATGFPTSENLTRELARLRSVIDQDDGLWVFWLGHGSRDGGQTWFHLPGPDWDTTQWSALFAGIEAREQVFWLTHAGSGDFVKAMSLPGRIVIAATDTSGEVNETRFPHALAKIMRRQLTTAHAVAGEAASEESTPSESTRTETTSSDPANTDPANTDPAAGDDASGEASLPASSVPENIEPEQQTDPPSIETILALFQATARQVLADFESESLAPTEHAQLDDNGDGVGTELAAFDKESLAQLDEPLANAAPSATSLSPGGADSLIQVDGVLASQTGIAQRQDRVPTTPASSQPTPSSSAAEAERE